jgi:hypothetical protein
MLVQVQVLSPALFAQLLADWHSSGLHLSYPEIASALA